MATCDFCPCNEKVNPVAQGRFHACWQCRTVSNKSKKTPIFYDILRGKYVAEPLARSESVLVLDLHNVCDRFTPQELAGLVRPFLEEGWQVTILSYVGSTTTTRIGAQDFALSLYKLVPDIDAYLCFRRGSLVEASNKGGFIKALGAPEVHFFDDSDDHIESGTHAGASSYLVTKDSPDAARTYIENTLKGIRQRD